MKKVGQFYKISLEQWNKDTEDIRHTPRLGFGSIGNLIVLEDYYHKIKLPRRATKGSAGYDFFTPIAISLKPRESAKVPTGIRVTMEEDWVLQIYPRSSLGFKFRMQLDNGTAIIDSDYYFSSNEGHIWIKITNDNRQGKVLDLNQGDAFAQGIFLPFGITIDDEVSTIRDGGIGSTNER